MREIKKWFIGKITTDEMIEYFHDKGMSIHMTFNKKQLPLYYAKNSRLYKLRASGVIK